MSLQRIWKATTKTTHEGEPLNLVSYYIDREIAEEREFTNITSKGDYFTFGYNEANEVVWVESELMVTTTK